MTAKQIVDALLENYPTGGDDWKQDYEKERWKDFQQQYDYAGRERRLDTAVADLKRQYPQIDIEPVDPHSAMSGAESENTAMVAFYFYPLFQVGGSNDGIPFPVDEAARIFRMNGVDYDPTLGTLDRYATSKKERIQKVLSLRPDAKAPLGRNTVGVPLSAYESDTDFQVMTTDEISVDDLPKLVPLMDQLRRKLTAEFQKAGVRAGFTNHKVVSTYR